MKRKGDIRMAEVAIKEINAQARANPGGLIAESEESYLFAVRSLAREIAETDRVRIVLLAGPSGSGKTTTAGLLCNALKEQGEDSIVVSLDDFYRDCSDSEYPRLENGESDFESPLALDIPTLTESLRDIAQSREFLLPRYDFKKASRSDMTRHPSMPHGCVIIEGIHALNPLVFSNLPKNAVLKLFISVSTNVNDGEKRILSGRKIRFLRRMIRDSIYRGASAERTLALWQNVLAGEDKYLYPNRRYADVSFDTFHKFELGALRTYALERLTESLAEKSEYARVVRDAILSAYPIDSALIPENSLIREFIGNG